MKKIFNFRVSNMLVVMTSSMLISMNSFAQCTSFVPASVAEKATGVNTPSLSNTVNNTGNDIKEGHLVAGTMAVNVWDGNNPGLGWDDYNGDRYWRRLPGGIVDPDVSLVEGYSSGQGNYTWYAIVVYSKGVYCWWNVYEWDLSTHDFSTIGFSQNYLFLQNNTSDSAYYSTSINIDADESGNFVIVWDDARASDIQVQGGSTSGGSTDPQLCRYGSFELGNAGPSSGITYISPDVALYYDAGNSTSIVRYTYLLLRSGSGLVEVYESYNDFYNDICCNCSGQTVAATTVELAQSAGSYVFIGAPRIACPAYKSTLSLLEWAVVVVQGDANGSEEIYCYAQDANSQYTNIYTDGSISGLCQEGGNLEPVVSFDHDYSGLTVAWMCDYNLASSVYYTPAKFNPHSVIAVVCDPKGFVNSNCYNGSTNGYMIVPSDDLTYNYVTQGLAQVHPSLAGRDFAKQTLYTFYDYVWTRSNNSMVYDDIQYKKVDFCNNSYSLKAKKGENQFNVSPNPFSKELKVTFASLQEVASLQLMDMTGKLLLTVTGNEAEINSALNEWAGKLEEGIYLLQIDSKDGREVKRIAKI